MGDVNTCLYIVRHAEAEGNVFRRAHGQYNGLVTPNGLRQLERLSQRFESIPVDAVYASDLYRTQRTALAISEPKGLPLITDARLREMLLGPWEDRPWAYAGKMWPEPFENFMRHLAAFRLDGAETLSELGGRMETAVREIAARHAGGSVAVVTHGMSIRALLGRLLHVADEDVETLKHVDNASVTALEISSDGDVRLEVLGDASHLGELSTLSKQRWHVADSVQRDIHLWFRPAEFPGEAEEVLRRQEDAWLRVYGSLQGFDAESCLQTSVCLSRDDAGCVQFVMDNDAIVGVLILSLRKSTAKSGHISLISLDEDYCGQGLGIQALGEAVSFYRRHERAAVKLNVWQGNERARRFYAEVGFQKTGEEAGIFGPLDVMERSIAPDRIIVNTN